MNSSLIGRFNTYQKERFPMVILVCTTFAVVMSSVIVSTTFSWSTVIAAFLVGILYLFHIRVIDEIRDYEHDNIYHVSRPIPRGIISIKELKILDIIGLTIIMVIAIIFGKATILIGLMCLLYTFIAGKEFFLGEKIRTKFFLYNGINLMQLILLQFFIYSLYSNIWYKMEGVWIHLLFIFINSILLEILRKIKIQPEESLGHDTYSWHIGFNKALYLFSVFSLASYLTFLWLLFIKTLSIIALGVSVFIMISLLMSVIIHGLRKSKKSEINLYLSTLGMYIGLNLIIYFIN